MSDEGSWVPRTDISLNRLGKIFGKILILGKIARFSWYF